MATSNPKAPEMIATTSVEKGVTLCNVHQGELLLICMMGMTKRLSLWILSVEIVTAENNAFTAMENLLTLYEPSIDGYLYTQIQWKMEDIKLQV